MHELRWQPLQVTDTIRLNPVQLELPLQAKKRLRWIVQEDVFSQDRYLGKSRGLVPDEAIAAILGVAALCQEQEFVFCTKHIGRKLDWFDWIENDVDGPVYGCLYNLRKVVGISVAEKEVELKLKWPLKNVAVLYFIGRVGVRCE